MFFCTDVYYDDAEDRARAAAVGFWRSSDEAPSRCLVEEVSGLAPYTPGELYRRELPPLLSVLERAAALEAIDLVLVDGHVWLTEGEPGLGHHLWRALGGRIPVFGIAKAPYPGGVAVSVLRGRSSRPLWVTSAGVEVEEAVRFVLGMHGEHRIPTLIARADALSRGRTAW